MIPKIIHYCWFGYNPKPKLAQKCIQSWKKYCPDYQIIEWNEDNFNISACPLYVRQAYEAKKWAFVTDYVRLKVVYDCGGIYLDTDVELKKKLDSLRNHDAYFGFEDGRYIATGLGFGSIKGNAIIREMMKDYDDIPFIKEDGTYDMTACPQRNTEVLLRLGLQQNNNYQILQGNILILPSSYLSPISFWTGIRNITKDTISIHWYSASWKDPLKMKEHWRRARKYRMKENMHSFLHIPNRVLRRVLGNKKYELIKMRFKKG